MDFYDHIATQAPNLEGRRTRSPLSKKNRSLADRRKLPFRSISRLARGANVGDMNHAGAAVEVAVNLDLLAYELLGFVLIVQLIV